MYGYLGAIISPSFVRYIIAMDKKLSKNEENKWK